MNALLIVIVALAISEVVRGENEQKSEEFSDNEGEKILLNKGEYIPSLEEEHTDTLTGYEEGFGYKLKPKNVHNPQLYYNEYERVFRPRPMKKFLISRSSEAPAQEIIKRPVVNSPKKYKPRKMTAKVVQKGAVQHIYLDIPDNEPMPSMRIRQHAVSGVPNGNPTDNPAGNNNHNFKLNANIDPSLIQEFMQQQHQHQHQHQQQQQQHQLSTGKTPNYHGMESQHIIFKQPITKHIRYTKVQQPQNYNAFSSNFDQHTVPSSAFPQQHGLNFASSGFRTGKYQDFSAPKFTGLGAFRTNQFGLHGGKPDHFRPSPPLHSTAFKAIPNPELTGNNYGGFPGNVGSNLHNAASIHGFQHSLLGSEIGGGFGDHGEFGGQQEGFGGEHVGFGGEQDGLDAGFGGNHQFGGVADLGEQGFDNNQQYGQAGGDNDFHSTTSQQLSSEFGKQFSFPDYSSDGKEKYMYEVPKEYQSLLGQGTENIPKVANDFGQGFKTGKQLDFLNSVKSFAKFAEPTAKQQPGLATKPAISFQFGRTTDFVPKVNDYQYSPTNTQFNFGKNREIKHSDFNTQSSEFLPKPQALTSSNSDILGTPVSPGHQQNFGHSAEFLPNPQALISNPTEPTINFRQTPEFHMNLQNTRPQQFATNQYEEPKSLPNFNTQASELFSKALSNLQFGNQPQQQQIHSEQLQTNSGYDSNVVNLVNNVINKGQGIPTSNGFRMIKSNEDNAVYLVGKPGMSLDSIPTLNGFIPSDFQPQNDINSHQSESNSDHSQIK